MNRPTPEGRAAATAETVVRRPPFSVNPTVGARGQRTQQRILDAALQVFDEHGYHQCSIATVTKLAGCSRVTFYQYFASKEDVFRTLTGQVARQLSASDDQLGAVTPDADGWQQLRAWIERYAVVRDRYESVFRVFEAAAESDMVVAEGSEVINRRSIARFRSRVEGAEVSAKQLDAMVTILLHTVSAMLEIVSRLVDHSPDRFDRADVLDSFADVVHRSLYGLDPAVNVHGASAAPLEPIPVGPAIRTALSGSTGSTIAAASEGASVARLVDAARDEFVARGYHGTRVDDIVARAGCSHGLFYRYFENREQLVHLLVADAMRTLSGTLAEIPDADAGHEPLHSWLRGYGRAQSRETAIIRVWIDATYADPVLRAEAASILDWGRERMTGFLAGRPFGHAGVDGIVLLGLVESFGSRPRSAGELDAAVRVVERGFLGRC